MDVIGEYQVISAEWFTPYGQPQIGIVTVQDEEGVKTFIGQSISPANEQLDIKHIVETGAGLRFRDISHKMNLYKRYKSDKVKVF